MIKTGIGSGGYFGLYDYAEGLKKMKKHGYDCVDLQCLMPPQNELYKKSEKEFADYFKNLKIAAKNAGIELWQMHALWPSDDTTAESRKRELEVYKKDVIAAGIAGCRYLVLHPVMPYGWGKEKSVEEARDLTAERFIKLLPAAKDAGVILCIENMPFTAGHSFSNINEIKNVIKRVNDPYMKACFDTGHCYFSGESHYDAVKILGSDLACTHVHDDLNRQDRHLIPFQGGIDWQGFAKGLKEIGFDGCISLETCINEKTPEPMKERMQIALSDIAKYLAKAAE